MAEIVEFSALAELARTAAVDAMVSVLEAKEYSAAKTASWVEDIGVRIIAQLREASPNFKFIVTPSIMQKTGFGLHYDVVSCWDPQTDGAISAKYESDSIICICTVIGIAL
jgi:hypothetical protein